MRVAIVDAAVTRELRRSVLRPTWPVGSQLAGDDVADAVHLAAMDGTEVVGACVLFPRPYPLRPDDAGAWQLRGMATAAHRRSQGVGALVLQAVVDELTAWHARLVWCDARSSARRFYERNGFRAEGAEFLHPESGLPHFRMCRELSAGPTSSETARRVTGA